MSAALSYMDTINLEAILSFFKHKFKYVIVHHFILLSSGCIISGLLDNK